jgi:hypothetical protein
MLLCQVASKMQRYQSARMTVFRIIGANSYNGLQGCIHKVPAITAVNEQTRRQYKNFGHRPIPVATFSKIWYFIIGGSIVGFSLDWKW